MKKWFEQISKKEFLFYIAGFFDGEGCIGINKISEKRQHRVEVQITNTCKEQLEACSFFYGGNVYHVNRKKEAHYKDVFGWIIADKQAELFLKDVMPFLVTKKEQARIALKYRSLPRLSNIINIKQINEERKQERMEHNERILKERGKVYDEFKWHKVLV
jgi:hypothetical protein